MVGTPDRTVCYFPLTSKTIAVGELQYYCNTDYSTMCTEPIEVNCNQVHLCLYGPKKEWNSLKTRPSKNRKGGSGKWGGVEVYTAPSMQAHFQLAFD